MAEEPAGEAVGGQAAPVVEAGGEAAPAGAAAPQAREPYPLEVRIVHGSLEYASEPVAVGHYQGMPLSGAEGFLDKKLHGLLSYRLLVGVYPEQEGTAVLVGPMPACQPCGALILGLGVSGEMTSGKVSRAMTQAVLLRALAAAEDGSNAGGEPTVVGVSSVLVGTNPLDGMTIDASLAALVEGTVSAVQHLQTDPGLWGKVRIGYLEIIERYEQRARAALTVIGKIADLNDAKDLGVRVRKPEDLIPREGGVPGQPADDYSAQAWLRLDIRSVPRSRGTPVGYRDVEFTSMARRARADRLVQRTEVALVNDLIARAVGKVRPDHQIRNTLFELLVPGELKYELFNADNVHLLLDPDTACFPWEALAPRYTGGDKPLAQRTGVLRQFAEQETRAARFTVRQATGRHVLVIGNPPAGDHGPDLPGATAEAQAVADFFGDPANDYEVHALIWGEDGPTSTNLPEVNDAQSWVHIVNALFRHEYRIVHIAAHGVFNSKEPIHSGVVIGPEEHFLTAHTFRQMPVVPEFVFLNCCHLGRMGELSGAADPDRQVNLLAASVARALMGIGVRAVVASGWAVDDAEAALFAKTFYTQAVNGGAGFGEAVHGARQAVLTAADEREDGEPESLTWAAYQCYGDPEFRLKAPTVDPLTA